MSDVLLDMRGICKRFPGVVALDGVDFAVRRGEIHALMGENGAGKSTLVKALTGVHRRDAGTVTLDGKEIFPKSPKEAEAAGISTVYQEVNLIPHMSVAENICLGREPVLSRLPLAVCLLMVLVCEAIGAWRGYHIAALFHEETVAGSIEGIVGSLPGALAGLAAGFALVGLVRTIRWGSAKRRARAALAKLDLKIDVTREVSSYSIAIQQTVAIARALDVSAKLLILDEPTSSLDAGEVAELFKSMRKLRDQGLGIVFITHFMDQVYAVSDRITVLRDGKLVGEYPAATLSRMELVSRMIGREYVPHQRGAGEGEGAEKGAVAGRDAFLELTELGRTGSMNPIGFTIGKGEVVGLAGLLGSGRTETARMIFGVDKPDSGTMKIDGKPVRFGSPRQAIRAGLAFTPEDRKREGIIPHLSVRENMIMALQGRRGALRKLSRAQQNAIADKFIKALRIKTPSAEQLIGNLSGGNQQKVLLARWLANEPKLFILDEPTRGIDVGAKDEIARLLESLCAQGMAILFISSELEEVVESCQKVVVLRDRMKAGELAGGEISMEAIMGTIARTEHAA